MERDNQYNQENRLQELGGSDYEIADNQPNIKGWTVKDPQGQTVGEVEELIFDVQSRKVRYMVVDLEGSNLDLEPRNVLVPIGVADLHDSDDNVILPNVTVDQLRSLPTYQKGRIDRDHETSVRSIFGGVGAAAAGVGAAITGSNKQTDNDTFYDHDQFSDRSFDRRRLGVTNNDFTTTSDTTNSNATGTTEGTTVIPIIEENLNIGKEEIETGGVHISSRVVERPVEEHVRLREERVFVEHTPVNRPISEAELNTLREGEIELTEHAEVPVVNKEARVVEEVVLEKEVEEHDEVIRDTVRHTEVDVDDQTTRTGTASTQTDVNLTKPDPSRTSTTSTNQDQNTSGTPQTDLGSIATGTTGTGIGKTGSGFTDTDRDRGSLTSDPTLI